MQNELHDHNQRNATKAEAEGRGSSGIPRTVVPAEHVTPHVIIVLTQRIMTRAYIGGATLALSRR